MIRVEMSDRDKIIAMTDPRELEGAQDQLRTDGRLTTELENLIALRIAQLRRKA